MSDFSAMKPFIAKVAAGEALSREEARQAFTVMMNGEASDAQIGGLLIGMRVRGETVEEITGAVQVMREKMTPVQAPEDAIDIVGTGGDASGSYNISTASAFVAAGAGVPVAKHGNRALSSKSGAADVLAALGVKLELTPEQITRCIEEAGVGFMFAPMHHAAMKHVGPARVQLGTRTVFNLLGPLSNPAGVKRQLVGVFAREWVEPLARVLGELGCEAAWVVHGDGGLDEISPSGPTTVAELRGGEVHTFEIGPEDAGLSRRDFEEIRGGDAGHNAKALRAVLQGEPGAYRDAVLLNAGGALVVAGRASDFHEGITLAAESIDSGRALAALEKLVEVSNAAS